MSNDVLDSSNSILETIKKMLGGAACSGAFDVDIIADINSTMSICTQLGIGPEGGFIVTSSSQTWSDFLGDTYSSLALVVTYIYMKVRLLFDPPANSSALEALKQSIAEFEWRSNVKAEEGV